MAKDVKNLLEETVARLPAGSATIVNAFMELVPILAIISVCKENVAGTMQPAADQIVKLCLDADLAGKKNIGIAGSTHRTVQEQVLTRSMHRIWL